MTLTAQDLLKRVKPRQPQPLVTTPTTTTTPTPAQPPVVDEEAFEIMLASAVDRCVDPDEEHPVGDDATVKTARAYYKRHLASKNGAICPACQRYGKFQSRKLTGGMVRSLALLRLFADQFPQEAWCPRRFLLDFGADSSHDVANMRWWGFIKEKPGGKTDGNPNSGAWAITQAGRDFLDNKVRVPAALFLYGKGWKAVGLLDSRVYVGVHEVWNQTFVYADVIQQDYIMPQARRCGRGVR